MSSERRSSGGGAMFALLLVIGFVAMFWWVIVAVLGVALLAVLVFYAERRIDAREDARAALVARADQQHALVLAGDDRGIYGEYTPKQID
jgi:hypothetical protein